MSRDLIKFAFDCGTRGPCAQFVSEWLALHGVDGVPSRRAIARAWRAHGVESGVELWCARLGLAPCDPVPGAVALMRPAVGGLLLGVIAIDGAFVTRSFSKVQIDWRPEIVRAWRV
jgi:hypothetical protein